jgi:hypothetical protein
MPRAAAAATAGCDDVDLLASEQPVFSPVRIERRDCDPRFAEACAAHRRIGERQRVRNPLGRDLIERRAQRHMRGHARNPHVVEHVHLAEEAGVIAQLREHLMLVVEAPTAGVQRRLVERRERDRFDAVCARVSDHACERVASELSGFRRNPDRAQTARDRRCPGR